MNTVFSRRPTVLLASSRVMFMAPAVRFLKPASMLRFGQMCQALWAYLDTTRQADVAQPVGDQSRLAGIEAAFRAQVVFCKRFYVNARGPLDLQLTQDASAAIDLVLGWDPITTPTFDLEKAVLRILNGARIV